MAPRSRDGNLDGEDNDALDEAGSGATPVKSSLGGRIRSGLQPGADRRGDTGDRPPRPRSSKQIVERLDDRERTLCFAASGLAVLAGILIYLVEHENPHFRLSKGQLTPETTLVIGLAVGVLLLGATLLGRRAPVGFVALFAFLAFGTQYFAGIPFLVLAVWLLVRSYKFQKEAAATRKASMASGSSPSRPGTRGTRGAATTTGTKSGAARSSSKGPSAAEANKRYTPKRPAPPPPKPTRRERKTAQASE